MTIPRHLTELNDALTKVERVASDAPERTFEATKTVAAAIDEASNALRRALMGRGLVALNDDRLRAVEAMMFGYLLAGNPAVGNEVEVAKGFSDALDGPAGERVMAQMVRDRNFLDGVLGARAGAAEPAEESAPPDEALLLEQARYVLRNLDVERPGCGLAKMAKACERAAERVRASEPDDAPSPRM